MVESFSKNCNFLSFLWVVLSIGFLQAQDKKTAVDIEKTYLHTDRSTYFMGEDIWYKAYNVRASNNTLFDNSNILYVELISPDSKIIARNKTNLEIGLGNGDFKLADSLGVKPGRYQIRAYTNWNRNFGEDFVFKKDIEIFNVFEPNPNPVLVEENAKIIKAITTGVENTVKVDFFPEGGSLLENVAGIVGFKAVDRNGNPIDVKGEIYDSDNELVTTFASGHDGMGKFQMIPIEGKNYYAKIKPTAETEFRIELPKALKQGYSLSFRLFKGKNIITINTNQATLAQNPNQALTVICRAKGISYIETTQTLRETSLSFELPKDKTPDGISQITLYDSSSKPQSERLVYIEKEADLEVQLAADKPSYKPNEKVTLNVSSKSKTGVAKSASFSISVTDMNGAQEDKDFGTNICSYFLMESDIRGKIYNPAYYFDPANLKRLEHLDNLLLTQGWRDFVWKNLPMPYESTTYIAEKGITISGKVKQLLGEKPLVNNNMTLGLMNDKHFNFFNATTDIAGVYKFENLMFSGKTTMYLNSTNEKGKFRGEIIAYPIEQSPILVSFKSDTNSSSDLEPGVVENVFKKYTAFGVKPENVLKEVTVSSSLKKKDDMIANYGNYGFADKTYIADEDTHLFSTIDELLMTKFPNVGGNIYIVDGRTISAEDKQSMVDVISPSDVLKIDVITGAQATLFFGAEAAAGVIAIYTNQNTGNRPKKETFHSIKQEITGFYTARVFYVPNPEKPNLELDNNAAVRNTIYWNPYVHPDKSGNVNVSYYNSGVETKVKVALEGITGSGIPVVKNTYYSIKK